MNCVELHEMLDQWMDDALTEEQRQQMVAHGRDCPQCAEAIRRTMQLKALLSQMEGEVAVPLETQAKWRGAVRQAAAQRKKKRLIRWIGSAAAALVVLAGAGWALNARDLPKRAESVALSAAEQSVVEEAAEEAAEEAVEEAAPAEAVVSEADMGEVVGEAAMGETDGALSAVPEAKRSAVIETDGATLSREAVNAVAFEEEAYFEAPEGTEAPMCAAVALRAPVCELSIRVEDVDTACDRMLDLVNEYEGAADVQKLEDGGANLYVEISAEDAEAFLNAVIPMDAAGQEHAIPDLTRQGTVLVLLSVAAL